jgi:AraC-like DNA-binding protein
MLNIFETAGYRDIGYAKFSHFMRPTQHPDRVMLEHDLVYMLEGDWVVGQDGEQYPVYPHDVFILQAKHHHYGVVPCRANTRTMFVHMSTLPKEKVINDPLDSSFFNKGTLLGLPMVTRCESNPRVRELFLEIIQSFWSETPGKHIKLSALTQLLLLEISLTHSAPLQIRDTLVAQTLNTIQNSTEKVYTLPELAELVDVSSRTLSERFKKATGHTLHQYQINLKLDMARLAIEKEPAKSFKELAASLGFYDEFHFSKLFKKKFGLAPSRFR